VGGLVDMAHAVMNRTPQAPIPTFPQRGRSQIGQSRGYFISFESITPAAPY
jgi:hypothetical protein